MGIAEKRKKDQEMAVRLRKTSPSPGSHRYKSELWPYHNNLGTNHSRMKEEGTKHLKQAPLKHPPGLNFKD